MIPSLKRPFFFLPFLCICFVVNRLAAQTVMPPKPLFDDPVHHGAADPVVVWNAPKKQWWMYYTNRRADLNDSTGVKWVHGTRIGIATSTDGIRWQYLDTASIDYRPDDGYTFWAPDIIADKGTWHMFVTYVPGTFSNWSHPREIIHCTSKDLRNWTFGSIIKLSSQKVIDPCIYKTADGWRMWYNNEADGKSIYYADSRDLTTWEDRGKAVSIRGEGPKVFRWKDHYWMIVDQWKGMALLQSDDLLTWKQQESRILENPGRGVDDQAIGGHCDVVVNGDRAYVYYFTHPGRSTAEPAPAGSFGSKRSVIQLAELRLENGVVTCDRDAPVTRLQAAR